MEKKLRILLVEDERSIRDGVVDVLVYHGYAPTAHASAEDAVEEACGGSYALLVLDVMLPGMSGFELCERVRKSGSNVPILMLTAKGSEQDVVQGFQLGADDYVTKPFSVRELAVRIKALLKRSGALELDQFWLGEWCVDPGRATASRDGIDVELTARELGILALLCAEPGRIVARRTLLQRVWQFQNPDAVETRTVDMHIAKLRKKLDVGGVPLIETVRGHGYRVARRG